MKILLPTDFSPNSARALEIAGALLVTSGGELHILHSYHTPTIDPSVGIPSVSDMTKELRETAEKGLEEFKAQAQGFLKLHNVDIHTHLESGLAVDVIEGFCKDNEVDLITMGTQGASGLEEVLLGTVTAEVMERSPAPVLGVPISSSAKALGKIAYATDFNQFDAEAIKKVLSFVEALDFELCLVHVETKVDSNDDAKLMEWYQGEIKKLSQSNRISFHLQPGKNVEEGLQAFIEKENIGILAMVMRQRSIWDRLLHHSHTKRMAFHSNIPVLALHQ